MEISILGPLRVWRDGEVVDVGGRLPQAIVARLALVPGAPVSSDRLVEDLWGDAPPPSATNSLQSYISKLRRAIGPEALVRDGGAYALRLPADALRSARFERLVQEGAGRGTDAPAARLAALDEGLDLWHGPALAGFEDETWAQGAAVRLEELRLAAVERRIDLRLEQGDHAAVVGDIEAAVAVHPLRERFTTQLVLALYRSGRQAEALRAYERTRTHLVEELGLAPSPELERLVARVLDQDPTLDHVGRPGTGDAVAPSGTAGPGSDAGPAVPPLPPAALARRRTRLVGREVEVARVLGALDEIRGGGRSLVVLAGEPGVGKTRLVEEVAVRTQTAGAAVLWGRCSVEALLPHQPVVEALRTAGREWPDDDPLHAGVAARPVLGALRPGEDVSPGTAHPEAWVLHAAVSELLADRSAAQPVVLVIDDLHWADAATVALLDHVLDDRGTGRLLVVATVRRPAGRATPALDALLRRARRDAALVEIDLPGLDAAAVAALFDALGLPVDEDQARDLHDRTGGNALFLEAVADRGRPVDGDDARDLPPTVRDLIDERLAPLGPEAAAVLTAAATIGMRVDLQLLGAVTEQRAGDLLDLLDQAVVAGILTEDEEVGWVTFPHALVRQALVARTTRNREAHLHLRIADAIEAGTPGPGGATAVATHLVAARRLAPPERVGRAALDAGRAAIAALDDAAAVAWAHRGLAALDADPAAHHATRTHLLLLEARAARHQRQSPTVARALDRAAAEARADGDPHLLGLVAQDAAQHAALVTFWAIPDEVVALIEEALGALGPDRPRERAALLAWLSIARAGRSAVEDQAATAAEAGALLDAHGGDDHVRAIVLYARRTALRGHGDPAERVALGEAMARAAAASGWTDLEHAALVEAVLDHLEDGDVAGSVATLERLRRFVAPLRRASFETHVLSLDACLTLATGDLDRAEALSAAGAATGEGVNMVRARTAQQTVLDLERGRLTADALDDAWVAAIGAEPATAAAWRALAAWQQGDADRAAALLGSVLADGVPTVDVTSWALTMPPLVEVAWRVGAAGASAALGDEVAPFAGRITITGLHGVCFGSLHRYHAMALAGAGDLAAAEAAIDRAVAQDGAAGFVPWLARDLQVRAAVRQARGRPADAAPDRAEATRLAAVHGTWIDPPTVGV